MTMPQPGASWQNMGFTFQVQAKGRPPYQVEGQWMVPSSATLGWGMSLPCKVDQEDPNKIALDWDAAEQEAEAAKQQPGGMMAGMPGVQVAGTNQVIDATDNPELRKQILDVLAGQGIDVGSMQTPPPTGPGYSGPRAGEGPQPHSAGAEDEADPIDRLSKLAELREKGILTQAEFEAQKAKLLGEI